MASCKSTPAPLPEVDPLSVLEEDSSIYAYVPVQNHKKLTKDVIYATVSGVTEKDAERIVEHVESLYAGLGTVKDRSRLQIVACGSIPQIAVNAVFKKKNGWEKTEYDAATTEENTLLGYPNKFSFYTRLDTDFELSFPSEKMFCASRAVMPLLDRYSLRQKLSETPYSDWIKQETEDILFYITKPGQYLRSMIGMNVNGCDAVFGKVIAEKDDNYSLEFYVHLSNEKAMRFFVSALSLSFGMMGGTVEQVDSLTVKMSGVEFSENKIIELFTRDPITGKHYKVVDDTIVEEKR